MQLRFQRSSEPGIVVGDAFETKDRDGRLQNRETCYQSIYTSIRAVCKSLHFPSPDSMGKDWLVKGFHTFIWPFYCQYSDVCIILLGICTASKGMFRFTGRTPRYSLRSEW